MKKIALFLAVALVITSLGVPFSMAAGNHNPYAGIDMPNYDEVINPNEYIKVSDTGHVSNVTGTARLLFKNVDFGTKGAIAVDVYHGTKDNYANGYIDIRIDDPSSTPVAKAKMVSGSWSVAAVAFAETTKMITGVHDVYISHASGSSNLFRIKFYESSGAGLGPLFTGDNKFLDIEDNPHKYSIYTLYELGFLDGINEDTYDFNLGVSRAEYAGIMFNILNDGTYSAVDQIYDDVKKGDKAFNAVSYLRSLGVISMPDDKMYNPGAYITSTDAVVMAVRALGFEEIAKVKGGYPAGYLAVAGEEGILDGVPMQKYLRRDEMATLIENVLNSDYLDFNAFSEYEYGFTRKSGILSKTRGILKGEGVVFANSYTSLTAPVSAVKDNAVVIDGIEYFVGTTPAKSLIGFDVNFFYKEIDGEKHLICIRPKKNLQYSVYDTTQGIDVISLNESAFKFVKQNNEKEETLSFAQDTRFIYNNKAIDKPLTQILDSGKFRGKITFVENQTDEDVVIIEQYQSVVVKAIDSIKITVTDSLTGREFNLNPKNGDVILEKGNKGSAFNMISAGNVLTVYSSKNTTGEKFLYAIIEDKTISGTITETDGEYVYIDGTAYSVSPQCNKILGAGVRGDFSLNSFGEIVTYKHGSIPSGTDVGIILQYNNIAAGTLNDVQEVKLFTKAGQTVIVPLAKNVVIDGVKCKTFAQTVTALSGVNMRTVVIYTLNSQGEATILDTYKPGAGGDNDRLKRLTTNGAEALAVRTAANTITKSGLSAYPFETVPEFFVFDEENNADTLSYSTTYPGGVSLGTAIMLDIYTLKDPIAQYVIWQGKSNSGDVKYKTPEFVYKKTEVVTEDGERGIKLTTKSSAGSSSYVFTTEDFNKYGSFGSYPGLKEMVDVLCKGDAIRVRLNSLGKVTDLEILMFCDGVEKRTIGAFDITASLSKTSPRGATSYSVGKFVYGEVISKTDNIIGVKSISSGTEYIEYFVLPKNVVYCEHLNGNTVLKEAVPSTNVSDGNTVAVFISSNTLEQVVLYNH